MNLLKKILVASCLLAFASSSWAKTTTTTTMTISGTPYAGATVYANVSVAGRHTYYNGQGTAFGGNVVMYVQGVNVANIQATGFNTTYTKLETGCCTADGGPVYIYEGEPTVVSYPVTLPATPGASVLISSYYDGDKIANGSNTAQSTVTVISRDVSAAINLLLN